MYVEAKCAWSSERVASSGKELEDEQDLGMGPVKGEPLKPPLAGREVPDRVSWCEVAGERQGGPGGLTELLFPDPIDPARAFLLARTLLQRAHQV